MTIDLINVFYSPTIISTDPTDIASAIGAHRVYGEPGGDEQGFQIGADQEFKASW
jgi:hypothetical protein